MRTLKEIQEGLDSALQNALFRFKGDKVDKETYNKIQAAVIQVADDYYRNKITEVEKDMYFINRPKPQVNITGLKVTIRGSI